VTGRAAAACLAAALLAAGCVSSTTRVGSDSPADSVQSLSVADVDGPPVDLLIGGAVVASVPCSGYATLTEGSGAVPRLPWSLDVRRQGGPVLRQFDVTTADGWQLLLRGDSIGLGQFGSTGPTSDPNACARWASLPVSIPPSSAAAVDQVRAGRIAREYFATAHGPGVTLTKVTETDLGITNDTACGPNWEVLMDGTGTEAGNPYHSTMYLCVDPATGGVTLGPAG
jgi:hypothetical protein